MTSLLNNRLAWDGSILGEGTILHKWTYYSDTYYLIYCHALGHIVCQANRTNSVFPCIVEDLRVLFDLPKRGSHRINIGGYQWVLYYIPLNNGQDVIFWEIPLSWLPGQHPIRQQSEFHQHMQRFLAFQEILTITQTAESNVRLRSGDGISYYPISYCEGEKTIKSGKTVAILSKAIYNRWLGSHCNSSTAAHLLLAHPEPYEETEWLAFCNHLHSEIERIVRYYDVNFLWLANSIVARLNTLISVIPHTTT